jgi:hypothetical protein
MFVDLFIFEVVSVFAIEFEIVTVIGNLIEFVIDFIT